MAITVLALVTLAIFLRPAAGERNIREYDATTLSGILHVVLGDSMLGGSHAGYYLHTYSGEYVQILPSGPVPISYSGREVAVSGTMIQLEDKMALSATAITPIDALSASPSPVVSGTKKMAMILLRYSDSSAYAPDDVTYYSNLMNPAMNSVNAFYREESYGLLGFRADVYGWYDLPNPRSYYVYGSLTTCGVYFNRLVNDGVALADRYVYFPQYDDVSFVMNDYLDCCAWGGTYTIIADGQAKCYGVTWVPPWAQNIGLYAHEIGHSLGCPHTGWVYSEYDSIWDVESAGTRFGRVWRGSYYSVAARQTVDLYSYDPCHHVAYHKIKLGWLNNWYSEISTWPAMITLNALAGPCSNFMAIKVRIPGQDPSKNYFTVEARTKINYDHSLPREGVIIHFVDEDRVCASVSGTSEPVPAYPIDSTPQSWSLDDAQWEVGTTYANRAYGIRISILSKIGNSYEIRIGEGFDFSLSSSGGITVTRGSSGFNTVTVSLTSGAAQPVTLSASLPSHLAYNVAISFSPPSATPTFTSTLTINTSAYTPVGSYVITVIGVGGGLTRTTTLSITVNP